MDRKEKAILCTGFPVQTDFSAEGLLTFIHKIQEYKKYDFLAPQPYLLPTLLLGRRICIWKMIL